MEVGTSCRVPASLMQLDEPRAWGLQKVGESIACHRDSSMLLAVLERGAVKDSSSV